MRVAHVTDIHWFHPPRWDQLLFKRVLGTANLYLRGRRHHFPDFVQERLIEHLMQLAPDLVLVTGDLTAQALPEEFEKARRALEPVLKRFPTFVIPGNHDAYTVGATRSRRIREQFADWMHLEGEIGRLDLQDLTVIGLDPNRPTWVNASGVLPKAQLVQLAEMLRDPALQSRFLVLAIHYPLLERDGSPYDGTHHGLLNARELYDVLETAPKRPDLVTCGHEHHGYRTELVLGEARVPVIDCGSSGYAFRPEKRRAAAMAVYTIENRALAGVERYLFDGETFAPEPGGAFATGR